MNENTDGNVARAAKLDTASLSDALDKLGIAGQCYRIKPRDASFRMAGRAWTLLYGPAGNPPGTVGDYIEDHWMRTGKDRVQMEATGVPVNIGDAPVAPGDLVKGDADGVVVIPREHEDRVLAAAEAIESAENRIREAVRGGMRLDEARKQFRYHQLQTRESE